MMKSSADVIFALHIDIIRLADELTALLSAPLRNDGLCRVQDERTDTFNLHVKG